MDNLREFVQQYLDGELELHIKSEPIPEDNSGPVTVRTALIRAMHENTVCVSEELAIPQYLVF